MSLPIDLWLDRIFGHEGGYSNRDLQSDPGGETKWGISKRSYPNLDIKSLTKEDAISIYRNDFINPLNLEQYPLGVAFQLLDFAINSGPRTAIKQLQEAIKVPADGFVGPHTLAKLGVYSDADLCALIVAERLEFMAGLKNFKENAGGWVRRMASNLRYAATDTKE